MRHRVVVVSLAMLLLGIFIGFVLGPSSLSIASAEQGQPTFEEISPVMTIESAGIGTLLAGRVATDEITVKGFDLIKLQENTLKLLASKSLFFSTAELQSVIDKSRAPVVLRMKPPARKKEDKK